VSIRRLSSKPCLLDKLQRSDESHVGDLLHEKREFQRVGGFGRALAEVAGTENTPVAAGAGEAEGQ
jgi:hypothetical protein